ncbi:hypothetical protein EMPS_07331 [Entomortierella parvispora]|uniref:YTH domain-containing protein n=1 Tax=Entomortierella parvispora TaxID=205924 RepID=A0A9P3HER2_9FUNG|nr:hypothetical protein EMPS_07331 [Entomortierella parvispora]
MGYHPGPMPPYDQAPPLQHPHHRQQQQQQQHPHQHPHPQHPHPQQLHSHAQHLPHGTGGSLAPIHGPTSAPLSISETSGKTLSGTHPATRLESISTPDMLQLESSPSLDSTDSSFTGSTELKTENKTNKVGRAELGQEEERIKGHQQSVEALQKGNSTGSQVPSCSSSSSSSPKMAHIDSNPALNEAHRPSQERPKRTGPQQPTSHHPDSLDTTESDSAEGVSSLADSVGVKTGLRGDADEEQELAAVTETTATTGDPSENSGTGPETAQRNHSHREPGQTEPAQQERHSETQNSKGGSQPIPPSSLPDTYSGQPQPPFSPHQHHPHLQNQHQGYQPQGRSSSAAPYYAPRHNHPHPKPFSGPQGQGPGGPHTPGNLAPGPPGHQGYGIPPPFYSPNNSVIPSSPGSRRPMGFHPQSSVPTGSHPMGSPGLRLAGPQYHSSAGFKPPPFLNQGVYPPEYPGYYHGPESWRGHPAPSLQKKPKELDKAMWVGNVLNDTTLAELQAIFEAEPTEAEGDVQHDVPESIFILAKSNCAFVNYSSHEAVDRAVLRFHDREFKNTRLVCRPRKDPATDSSSQSGKSPGPGRFQSQMNHPSGESPYLSPLGFYEGDPTGADHSRRYEMNEAQASMERMRLSGRSPVSNSPSSGGEGGPLLKEKDRSSKKSRSSSSLGFSESRYFILKSLNEEDLKLSVQYGQWATQDHLVPILNDAFENTRNVYLVFSANKSGEFFGYARMTSTISSENSLTLEANEPWKPSIEIPLSPEMRASLLEEYEQATKEGRQLTNEEAEIIARGSTTTTSWGTVFTVEWIQVHKVPFSRTTHLLNPLYENREVKVSKDGTEVEASVGEQLLSLFQRSNRSQRDEAESASNADSQSNSETGSRRSSVAGDNPATPSVSSLAPPAHLPHQTPRSSSSRRSSIMSSRSVGSNSARERRTSVDPSSSSSQKGPYAGQHHKSGGGQPSQYNNHQRGPYGGDGHHHHQYQTHSPSGGGGYRSSQRQGGQYGYSGYDQSSAYHPSNQHGEHQRQGWKSNYRGGPSSSGSYGGSPNPGTEYGSPRGQHMMAGHSNHYQDQRKGGNNNKYNNNYGYDYPYPSHQPYYQGTHGQRRPTPGQGGPHHQHQGHNSNHGRPNLSPPAADSNGNGNAPGYKTSPYHDYNYSGPRSGPSPPSIAHTSPPSGTVTGGPQPMSQQHGPPPSGYPGAPGGPPLPFHPHGHVPPPGYPMMGPSGGPIPGAYMGYNPYAHPGPSMMMHHPMVWHHPSQGPLMSPGMIPAPIPGSTSIGAAATAAGAEINTGGSSTSTPGQSSTSESRTGGTGGGEEPEVGAMEGAVPYFDGVSYGYMPAEEAYQQSMYGYGYMPAQEGGSETDGGAQGEHGNPNSHLGHPGYGHYPQHPGAYPHPMYHHPYQQYPAPYYGQPPHPGSHAHPSQGPLVPPPAAHFSGHQQQPPMGLGGSGPGGSRPSRSDSSSTRSSTSTLIPATSTHSGHAAGGGATGLQPGHNSKTKDADEVVDVVVAEDVPVKDEPAAVDTKADDLPPEEPEALPVEEKSVLNPDLGGALGEGRTGSEPVVSISAKDSASRSRPKAKSTPK